MPYIKSPNPDFQRNDDNDPRYAHPAESRSTRPIPMAFQITSPVNRRKVLLPHSLVLHVNPMSLNETHTQKIERFQTRGGWVEQHWGHDLTEVSADATTGAFMNVYTGTASVMRQRTIAWDRFRDLLDLYHNNGSLRDPFGNIVLQGYVQLMFDRGTHLGSFRSFEVTETADSPFAFQLSWSFKIERTLLKAVPSIRGIAGDNPFSRVRRPNPTTVEARISEEQKLLEQSKSPSLITPEEAQARLEQLEEQNAILEDSARRQNEQRIAEENAQRRSDAAEYGVDVNKLFPSGGS